MRSNLADVFNWNGASESTYNSFQNYKNHKDTSCIFPIFGPKCEILVLYLKRVNFMSSNLADVFKCVNFKQIKNYKGISLIFATNLCLICLFCFILKMKKDVFSRAKTLHLSWLDRSIFCAWICDVFYRNLLSWKSSLLYSDHRCSTFSFPMIIVPSLDVMHPDQEHVISLILLCIPAASVFFQFLDLATFSI